MGRGAELQRFNGLRGQIRRRLRNRFISKFGLKINSNLTCVKNTAAHRARLTDYFCKEVWFDMERIRTRNDYHKRDD